MNFNKQKSFGRIRSLMRAVAAVACLGATGAANALMVPNGTVGANEPSPRLKAVGCMVEVFPAGSGDPHRETNQVASLHLLRASSIREALIYEHEGQYSVYVKRDVPGDVQTKLMKTLKSGWRLESMDAARGVVSELDALIQRCTLGKNAP